MLAAAIDAPITLHFHPDRRLPDGRSVAEALRDEGVYRSQFETGISNGLLGGDRLRWEHELFAGAYDEALPADRPKYGALNVNRRVAGACPGFGSCHLRLRPEVNRRTTQLPVDDYLEAHVHGPVRLAEDAEGVVLDPVYAGTEFAEALAATALPVEWHDGFVLAVADIPAEPLGEQRWQRFCADGRARAYAERLGVTLDAAVIGRAAAELGYTDELKDLWVMTVTLGRGRTRAR
jgi:hypothetical protein